MLQIRIEQNTAPWGKRFSYKIDNESEIYTNDPNDIKDAFDEALDELEDSCVHNAWIKP